MADEKILQAGVRPHWVLGVLSVDLISRRFSALSLILPLALPGPVFALREPSGKESKSRAGLEDTLTAAGAEQRQAVFGRLLERKDVANHLSEKGWIGLDEEQASAFGGTAKGGFILRDSFGLQERGPVVIAQSGLRNPMAVKRGLAWVNVRGEVCRTPKETATP